MTSEKISDSTKIVLVNSDVPTKKPRNVASKNEDAVTTQQSRTRKTEDEIREFSSAENLASSLSSRISTLTKEEVEKHHDLDPATVVALTS